jgi:outer membrane beta-barrel protein
MRFPPTIVALLLLAAALPGRAQPVEGGPATVQRKLFTMSDRWETGIAFSTALNTSLVDQYGALASISYHPNEWADVGFDALVNSTRLSGLAQQVRSNLPARTTTAGAPLVRDEIAHADQLRVALLGTGRIAPIYGKLNLASELTLHFQAFVLAGGGVAQVRHESVNLCAVSGTAACPPDGFQSSDSFKPVGQVGAGMRFYFGQRFSLRAELRAFLLPASYRRGADLTVAGSGSDRRYLGVVSTLGLGASALF